MAFSVRSLHRVGKRAYSQASAPLPNVYRHLHEPYGHRDRKPKEVADPRQAFEEVLKPEKQLFFQSAGATPTNLIQAAVDVAVANKITDIESSHIHIEGTAPHLSPEARSVRWRDYNFFTGSNSRKAVQQGEADYIPIFLSEIPLLYRKGLRKVDVALISVSPPDKHGYCSLGPSVDVTRAALQCADVIVAQINKEVRACMRSGVCAVGVRGRVKACCGPPWSHRGAYRMPSQAHHPRPSLRPAPPMPAPSHSRRCPACLGTAAST